MTTKLTDLQIATVKIANFKEKFGQPHLDLACHAAFPMALTPDLLYRLWAHFRRDVYGQPLPIPWVAVADVLLAPFCREVGANLYEIEADTRNALLYQLKADPRFGPQRWQALARFLLTYHQVAQLHSDDPDLRELAQLQRWMALAQTQSAQVVHDLAHALVAVPGSDGAEWGRMAALLARLQLPDGEAQTLQHYANGMARLTQGEPQMALGHFQQLPGGGRRAVTIAGVTLTMPEDMQPLLTPSPAMTRRRWLLWAGWAAAGTVGAVAMHRVLNPVAPTSPPVASPSELNLSDVVFAIDVVTVNPQGQEVERQPGQVNGRLWSQKEPSPFSLEVVNIPAGEFEMGSPESEVERFFSEGPQRRVSIPAFSMGRYPVTQAQWRFVAGLPQVNQALEADPARFKGDDRPVEQVSWYGAVEFCDRLSNFLGTPCRLPSEAEWEYACRAGTTTPFHFGETITPELANYDARRAYGQGPTGQSRGKTTAVGSFGVANAFGLYDMHGNVWEWCADHWHYNYEGAPIDGSAWTTGGDDSLRVLRGGSWIFIPRSCRSAYRIFSSPRDSNGYLGFRVVSSAPRALL